MFFFLSIYLSIYLFCLAYHLSDCLTLPAISFSDWLTLPMHLSACLFVSLFLYAVHLLGCNRTHVEGCRSQ